MKILIPKNLLTIFMIALPTLLMAETSHDDLTKAIEAQNAIYMSAYRVNDVDAIIQLYTPDTTLIAPNAGPSRGIDNVRAGLAEELALGDGRLDLHTLEMTRMSDDMAYEFGEYTLDIDLPDGESMHDEGNMVVIWKRGDDSVWRLHVDIWNSSLPMP